MIRYDAFQTSHFYWSIFSCFIFVKLKYEKDVELTSAPAFHLPSVTLWFSTIYLLRDFRIYIHLVNEMTKIKTNWLYGWGVLIRGEAEVERFASKRDSKMVLKKYGKPNLLKQQCVTTPCHFSSIELFGLFFSSWWFFLVLKFWLGDAGGTNFSTSQSATKCLIKDVMWYYRNVIERDRCSLN